MINHTKYIIINQIALLLILLLSLSFIGCSTKNYKKRRYYKVKEVYKPAFTPLSSYSYFVDGDNNKIYEVKISLFNESGKLIDLIFDGRKNRGKHTISIEDKLGELSSGIYFLKFTIDGVSRVEKFIKYP